MQRSAALFAVSLFLLAGGLTACTERTILHGDEAAAPLANMGNRIVVWFVKPTAGGEKIVAVYRPRSSPSRLAEAIADLLAGPSDKESSAGLGSEIPRGTILIGLNHRGADLELNLSQRFASGGGSSSFDTRMQQLIKTVSAAAGAENVYLNVEGKRLNIAAGEGIEIHQPLNR